jgi:hypothetical protein
VAPPPAAPAPLERPMTELFPIRRITVYAAQALEKPLIEQFLKLGSKGYTVTEARGEGAHRSLEDPFAKSTHVRIELLVREEVADKIMHYIAGLNKQNRAVVACVESVSVVAPDHF